jgi:hypothetical protein
MLKKKTATLKQNALTVTASVTVYAYSGLVELLIKAD